MTILFEDEQPKLEIEYENEKLPALGLFDIINAITYTKEDVLVDDRSEKIYPPYMVNKGLSYGADTVFYANEMNSRHHIDKKLQFSFLINIIRAKKRYNKWIKPEKIEAIELVKEYYGYSTKKAHQVLPLLSDSQIELIRKRLIKGGRYG